MKKRVRVYQKGGFNGFGAPVMPPLRIAQEGANVQQPQYTDEQLVSVVMSIVGEQGGSPEDAMQQLVSAGVDQNKANQVVSSAIEYINQQRGQGQQAQQQQGQSEEEIAQAQAEADAQAQQQEEADRQSRYNTEMANDQADLDEYEAEIDAFAAEHILRNGGALPSKRSFVKNVMKLTKKAAGGAADDTDIPNGRQAGLQAFVGNLKGKANGYLQEQDAKAMYDMMAPLANESDMYGEDPQMQFGGMRPGQQRRMERRANRMAGRMPAAFFNAQQQMFPQGINIVGMPGMMPGMAAMGPQAFQLPARGLYAGGPQLANIQVHKTGLFGRPKAWTATFNNSAPYNPNQWLQDMARMNQANKQTEYLDADFDKKEEETNTATAENAEVKNEEAKVEAKTTEGTETTGGGGNGGTENTGKDDRPGVDAPDTNEDVEAEVDENTKKATYENPGIDYNRYFPGAAPITRETLDSRFTNRIPGNVDPRTLSPEYNQGLADLGYYDNGDVASRIGKGVTIPTKGTEVKPTLSDLGSTKMIPGMKSVQKSEPVKLKLTQGETVFQLKSGDTKSHFVNKNGKIYKTSKLGDNSQWYEIKDPERVQNIINLSGRSKEAFNISKPKTTTQPKTGTKPGISDLGKTISQPAKQSKPINFVAAHEKVGEDEDFRNTVLQSPGKDDDSAYTWKNGKLYETPDFTEQAGFEDWYEVTDPKKIASVTKRMKSEDIDVPGDRNYTALQNLERNYRKDPTIGKDLRIPSEERFASSTIDPKYRNLAMRNGKLYIDITMDDDWVEVTDPTFKKNILADRAGQITSGQTITERLPNFDQLFADGGFTDSSNPNLYRFVYGGDDISVPTLNERNTADPYFGYGGYFQTGGGMVAINDASGNRKYVTKNEADAWNSAIKDNADLSLNDMSWASESPRQNPNYRTWDDLKDKGVNVGDYREGIDYSGMVQPKRDNLTPRPGEPGYNQSGYNYPMYNPAIGAMYPPLFGGGRRFSPAGRMFEYAGSWAKQKGMPFDPRTGQMLGQMPTDLPLTKLDVTKSSMFGKRPKEYTMYFGNYGQLGDNLPKGTPGASGANAANAPEGQVNDRRNKFAERLMRTPGLRKLGAKLYEQPNLPLPEGTQYTQEQMPSLPLKPIGNIPTSDLVPDQYNRANQPTMDLTGLKDAPIPEVTPEEFSFADQQRFGNVQGPLNQEEATGMGSLPMRPLSNIPTQYDDQLMASNFNYSPQGMLKAADIDELQRFIPQPQGAITEEGYANELDLLGFPDAAPVMRDISGNAIQPGQGTPMNIAGPMSDMSNLPDEQGYFNDLQLEQNQEQRIANLPPESASYDYYQDVMQPNRDRSEYDFSTDQMLTPEERAQQAQENLEGFDPMRLPDESGSMPEPWMTQGKVDAQQARIRIAENRRLRQQEAAAKKRAEEKIRKEREQRQQQPNNSDNTQGNTQQTNTGNAQQVTPKKVNNNGTIDYGKNASIEDIYNDLIYKYTWGEVEAGFDEDTGIFDMKKVEKYRKDLEEQQKKWAEEEAYRNSPEGKQKEARELRKQDTEYIKELKIPIYANYKTREDLFKAIQAGHVKSPETVSKNWDKLDDNQRRQKELDVKLLNQEYERWLMSNTDDARNLNASGSVKLTGMDVMINGVSYPEVLIKGKRYYRKKSGGVDVFVPIKKMGGATLPMAQPGMITTANPNYVGLSDADMLDAQSYSQYFGNANNVSGNWWTGSPNIPRAQYGLNTAGANKYGYGYDPNSMDSEETQFKNWWNSQDKAKTDAMLADQEKELEAMNAYDVDLDAENKSMDAFANDSIGNNNPFAVKMKRKDMYNVDFPVIWGQAKGLAGMAGNIFKEATEGRENTRNMLRNTYAETMEPTNQRLDLGNWTKHSGAYIPKDTGFDFDRQDRKAKGGSMGDGQVTYMSAAQVKKFLAEGGELEFI